MGCNFLCGIAGITGIELMAEMRIRTVRFDEFAKFGRIRAIKKSLKIYVPVGEVDRYFSDVSVR